MVNKDSLLTKLFTYGIRGLAHRLLRIHLENRQQYAINYNNNPCVSPITMGVPQTSNLGQIRILILINDMIESCSINKTILFVDDTGVNVSKCNEFNLYNIMNADLEKV